MIQSPGRHESAVAEIIQFPGEHRSHLQRVQAAYTLREVQKQFGIPEKMLRRWLDQGLVQMDAEKEGAPAFGIAALTQFRQIREWRAAGKPLKQIDEELRGQLDLFAPRPAGILRHLSEKRSAFEEGLILLDRGDASAEKFFRRAADDGDHRSDAFCNLGIIEFERGNAAEAMQNFIHALEEEPGHFESHYNLANLYFDAGDIPLARLHFEASARLEPEYAETFFNLGLVYARTEDWENVRRSFERYVAFEEIDHRDAVIEILEKLPQNPPALRKG